METALEQAAAAIAELSRALHARGWVPATSGNFSVRIRHDAVAVTASGRHKGQLDAEDVIRVDLEGQALDGGKPSAETGLHLQLYRRDPDIGAVLHTHALNAVLASRDAGDSIGFEGLERLKAFPGVETHATSWSLPVYDNDQDIARLAAVVESRMQRQGQGVAYLIRGHGVYAWGEDLDTALRHLEAVDYLLGYYLRIHSGNRP